MKVDSINIGLPAGLQDLRSMKPKDLKKRVEPPVPGQGADPIKPERENSRPVETSRKETNKAFFAVDDNGNVVIRIVDAEGGLIRQLPPEEYLKTANLLKDSMSDLFHVKV